MLEGYRKKLLTIWGIGFVIPFLLLLFQFGNGKYGYEKSLETLGWLTSLTLPTVLLMFGVIIASPTTVEENDEIPEEEMTPEQKKAHEERLAEKKKEKLIFQWATGVSLLYLLIINMVFFLEPLSSQRPQELMRGYKIFLAAFESLISLLIGFFFGRK